jgi:hypothetical protein
MVFYSVVLIMKPRPRAQTAQTLREFALQIYGAGGLIRRFSNEGIMRPYNRHRDTDNEILTYARYVTLQIDMGEENQKKLVKALKEHADVFYVLLLENLERPLAMKNQPNFFALDSFSRMEEEIHWPPQASADLYEQLDMNWKEFSRTRWSNYLRS